MTEINRIKGVAAERAILVGVLLDGREYHEDPLDELAGLAETVGAEVVGRLTQRRGAPDITTYLGKGKVDELKTLAAANDADVAKAFPLGTDVEVIVLDVDAASRRIRLSRKAVAAAQEAEEMREYTERRDRTPAGSFGSLADKLKGALGNKR